MASREVIFGGFDVLKRFRGLLINTDYIKRPNCDIGLRPDHECSLVEIENKLSHNKKIRSNLLAGLDLLR